MQDGLMDDWIKKKLHFFEEPSPTVYIFSTNDEEEE